MNDSIKQRVLRIVLDGGFYDMVVPEEFDFKNFTDFAENRGAIVFENESISLFVPWSELRSMFTFHAEQPVKLNIVNFPGGPTCEPPKAS